MNRGTTRTGGSAIESDAKRMAPIPVSRSRSLLPFLDFGYRRRMPVDRWLEQCRLPSYLHEDPDGCIATAARWKCVSLMAQESDTDDLGLRIAHDSFLDIMGSRVLSGVLGEPTLLSGIEAYARLIRGESSGTIVWPSLRETTIHFHLKKAFEPGTPGFRQTEWQGLMHMVTMIRLFAGREWQPDLISVRSRKAIPSLATELLPGTRFETGRPSAFLSFPRTLLSTGLSDYGDEVKKSLPSAPDGPSDAVPPAEFEASLQQILRAYLPEGYPPLSKAAEIVGMSRRTLQRRLGENGHTYSTLVARTRFDAAVDLLTRTGATSLEIAMATGYEDPSHFARAFKRIAGCSPREYRSRLAA